MIKRLLLLPVLLLMCSLSWGQSGACDGFTPYYSLSGLSDDSLWISNSVSRNGDCCGVDVNCVEFEVTLNANSKGIIFNINSGAIPGGNPEVRLDCGNFYSLGEFIPLTGGSVNYFTFCGAGSNLNSYSIQCIPKDICLVAQYDFNGNANDLSGWGNHGTVNGATLTCDRFGRADSAYYFDGVDDFIEISNTLLPSVKTSYTLSTWINLNDLSTASTVICDRYGGGNYAYKYRQAINNTDSLFVTNKFDGTTSTSIKPNEPLIKNIWYNFITTYDETSEMFKLYVDGIVIDSIVNSANWSTANNPTSIGRFTGPTTGHFFTGKIDDIKLFNCVLDSAQVDSLYNAEKSPLDPCLVAKYDFNGNADDLSGNCNHGTVNGATLTCDRFGRADSAYYFDGSTSYIEVFDSPSLDITSEFTLVTWIKKDVFNNRYEAIITKDAYNPTPSNADSINYKFQLNTANQNTLYSSRGNNVANFNLNEWVQFVGVNDKDSSKLYVNGILIDKKANQFNTLSTLGNNMSPLTIGRLSYFDASVTGNEWMYFEGAIDDIKIFNCALSASQIDSIYQAEKSPLDPCLIAKYDFNGNADDLSGNCNHGTENGGVIYVADRFGNPNSAASFDGVDDYIQSTSLFGSDTSDYTINVWLKYTGTNSTVFISDRSGASCNYRYHFTLNSSGPNYLEHTQYEGISPFPSVTTTDAVSSNEWHLMTGTYNSKEDSIFLYLDGKMQGKDESTLWNPANNLTLIGARDGCGTGLGGFFEGLLDDIRFYNCYMSAQQIDSIWKSECVPFTSNNNISICNYDSLLVGGAYQTTDGAYIDTLTAINGCDSIVTTNLTVLSPVIINETTNNITCNGGNDGSISSAPTGGITGYTFFWSNGLTSSSISGLSANVYSLTLTDGMGCIANGAYTITEPSVITSTDAQTICTGDSILIGGNYQSTAGLYNITTTASNGCDSLVAISITVNPILNTSVTASICDGDSLLVGGAYQTTAGNYNDTTASLVTGCDSVITTALSINNSQSNAISGTIYFTGSPISSGEVKLIRKDGNSPQTMNDIDSMMVNGDGTYLFDSLASGNYLIKALGDTSMYQNVATYGDSTNHWQKAVEYTINVGCLDTTYGANIYLIDFPTTIGFGNINGTLRRGGPARAGDPIPGIDISLEQIPGGIIKGGGTTGDNGDFTLKNIEAGDYYLRADMPGYIMDTTGTITFDGTAMNYDVQICAYDTAADINLCAKTLTIIAEVEAKEVFELYPNPANNSVTLNFSGNDVYYVEVIDLTGKTILTLNNQTNNTVIDISDISKGVYTINVTNGKGEFNQKLIIH